MVDQNTNKHVFQQKSVSIYYIPIKFRYYPHNVVLIILSQCYSITKYVYEKKTACLVYVRPMINTVCSVDTGQ